METGFCANCSPSEFERCIKDIVDENSVLYKKGIWSRLFNPYENSFAVWYKQKPMIIERKDVSIDTFQPDFMPEYSGFSCAIQATMGSEQEYVPRTEVIIKYKPLKENDDTVFDFIKELDNKIQSSKNNL